jgi:REP element-mobilizing transposase RayT
MLLFEPRVARQVGNDALFLTWRLNGTLPYLAKPNMPGMPGQTFFALDRALDTAASGPKWIEDPTVAQSMMTALRFGEQQLDLYKLLAYCLMPNHVHLVLEPLASLSRINHSIKEITARNATQILRRVHQPFWHEDSYERRLRDATERDRMVAYTESDPVTAGLVREPGKWPWSSASQTLTAQSLVAL